MATYSKAASGKLKETNTQTIEKEYSLSELQAEKEACQSTIDSCNARISEIDKLISEYTKVGATK